MKHTQTSYAGVYMYFARHRPPRDVCKGARRAKKTPRPHAACCGARTAATGHTMLAFDIETFGLDPRCAKISVICTECIFTGKRKTFEFAKHNREVGGPPTALTAELEALNPRKLADAGGLSGVARGGFLRKIPPVRF